MLPLGVLGFNTAMVEPETAFAASCKIMLLFSVATDVYLALSTEGNCWEASKDMSKQLESNLKFELAPFYSSLVRRSTDLSFAPGSTEYNAPSISKPFLRLNTVLKPVHCHGANDDDPNDDFLHEIGHTQHVAPVPQHSHD